MNKETREVFDKSQTPEQKAIAKEQRKENQKKGGMFVESEKRMFPADVVDKHLQDPNILNNLVDEVQKIVSGEKESIKALIVFGCGKYVQNANPTSFNVLINSTSRSGKDFIVRKVLKLFPVDKVIKKTDISQQTLKYYTELPLSEMIMYIPDIQTKLTTNPILKIFLSEESLSSDIVETQLDRKLGITTLTTQGKPVFISTTANAELTEEMMNRFNIINLDESQQQTKRILRKRAEKYKRGFSEGFNPEIIESLRVLERLPVIIPYAEEIAEIFPDHNVVSRTKINTFFDLICSITALRQKQVKKDKKGFLLADKESYKIAVEIFKKIHYDSNTNTSSLLGLTRKQKKVLKLFDKDRNYFIEDLSVDSKEFSPQQISRLCNKLCELGLIERSFDYAERVIIDNETGKEKIAKGKPKTMFSLADFMNYELPENYDDLIEIVKKREMFGGIE